MEGCRHINGFQVGVFPVGGTSDLTASTNARETVRATKKYSSRKRMKQIVQAFAGVLLVGSPKANNTVRHQVQDPPAD